MTRVSYIFPISHKFRFRFHELLRERLAREGIEYSVLYCDPPEENVKKQDTVDIAWGKKVGKWDIFGGRLIYQFGLLHALKSDLVIVQQENRLLLNYPLQILALLGLKRVAFFGHGRNFQSRRPDGLAERWKKLWVTKVSWWFGYTSETKRYVAAQGFPADRITVFNNAVDTRALSAAAAAVTPEQLSARRRLMGIASANVAVFVGGIYPDKRPDFLIDAAELVRRAMSDFILIIVGGGPDFASLKARCASHPWIHLVGPVFGTDKVELMRLGKVFLMPGLVGLAVLDAMAVGLPMITTAYPFHSPEIAYLKPGQTGEIVADWENVQAYADTIVGLLSDPDRLAQMTTRAQAAAAEYTVENMAARFASGVLAALGKGDQRVPS